MDKTILVVGASKGIGREISKQLLGKGARVIGISRTAAEDVSQHYTADVLTDALPVIEEQIDGIVYCPGSITLKPFRSLKADDIRRDMEISVMGAVRVLQHYLPRLQGSESASVVLFSTVAVQTGMPYHASVAAAKGAVEGLARSLAAEWAPVIRVNCIAPTLTDTPMAARLLDTEAKRLSAAERHPLKRIGDSSHIAAMACYLLSDAADLMTGQVIKMDGGISSVKI
jgi:3-oxoacyl-[acyl-carrier protein] reductase